MQMVDLALTDTQHDLSVTGVTKSFGAFQALKNISFFCKKGTITGLIGPNGSGKTTLLKAILGLYRVDVGTIYFGDKSIRDIRSGSISSVIEPMAHHPRRSVKRTLQSFLYLTGSKLDAQQLAIDYGLSDAISRKYSKLSLGMKQRVCLAIALHSNPDYLILDEPLNGLDVEAVIWLKDKLKSYCESGGTVLISSHLLNELQNLSNEFLILSQGEIVFQGRLQDEELSVTKIETDHLPVLVGALQDFAWRYEVVSDNSLRVFASARDAFQLCVARNIPLDALIPEQNTLLDIYQSHVQSSHTIGG